MYQRRIRLAFTISRSTHTSSTSKKRTLAIQLIHHKRAISTTIWSSDDSWIVCKCNCEIDQKDEDDDEENATGCV